MIVKALAAGAVCVSSLMFAPPASAHPVIPYVGLEAKYDSSVGTGIRGYAGVTAALSQELVVNLEVGAMELPNYRNTVQTDIKLSYEYELTDSWSNYGDIALETSGYGDRKTATLGLRYAF